ncbi:Fic family protein [Streptomyces sp. NPDC057806]|uniref:Fic family protein n=1 Tax=Streptomyces sp. NPDC057806 TaxID=3346255 RepID=UPI0036A4C4F2
MHQLMLDLPSALRPPPRTRRPRRRHRPPPGGHRAGLFASAVRRPRARMSGTRACVDPYEQAAAPLHALATNHAVADGNKRTARLAAAAFLAVNGVDLADCDQHTAYDLVIDVASGGESGIAVIAGRLRQL